MNCSKGENSRKSSELTWTGDGVPEHAPFTLEKAIAVCRGIITGSTQGAPNPARWGYRWRRRRFARWRRRRFARCWRRSRFDGLADPFEHPAVLLTSATTASLHCPFMSVCATQKNAPPLQENSPLLVVLRSTMTWTAWAALAFEPVVPQSEMQKPKTI